MMTLPAQRLCPACRASLPAGAIAGLCPHCVLRISVLVPDHADEPWQVLGDYALFEEIARGGMGVVYRARQRRLDRAVAVKVLRGGEFASAEARARFRTEATAAARLQHPGIVAIHDIGEADGVLWFSMDLVPGDNLAQRVRETPLAARAAAECVQRVAAAVQHAHEHGVLHRDLKPSNILVDESGAPRITDFGIARSVADHAEITRPGQVLGSPGYAAPEQALGGQANARTDVYGLGALLYHLLTGRPPFQGPTLDSILLQLRENDPVSPRRLNPTVPRDLEVICLQALRKDPARRYATAREVGEDLSRFLGGEPIRARPLGPVGRLLRWSGRRPWTAALLALVVALLVTLIAGALAFGRRQAQLEHRAMLLGEARQHRAEGRAGGRTRALGALREAWRIQPSAELRDEAIAALTLPEIGIEAPAAAERPWPPGASVDGRRAVRREGGVLVVSERATGREIARLDGGENAAFFQLDDTGDRLAVARADSSTITLLAIPSGQMLRTLEHPQRVTCLDWSSEFLAAGCLDRFVYVWDTAIGARRHRFSGHDSFPTAVRFRPRGQELISLAEDRNVRLWHAGRGVALLHAESGENHGADAWWADAEGTRLVGPRADGRGTQAFHFTWPRSVHVFAPGQDEPHSENIRTLSLDARGARLSTVDERSCRVWTHSGTLVAEIAKDRSEWFGAALTPDGAALWLSGWNTGVRRFPLIPKGASPTAAPVPTGALLVAERTDGGALAFTKNENDPRADAVWLFFPETGRAVELAQPAPFSAAFSSDGRWAVTGSFREPGVRVWRLPEGRLECELPVPIAALALEFTRDSRHCWIVDGNHVLRWQVDSWTPGPALPQERLPGFTPSPDGRFVACHGRNNLRLLRADDLREIARLAVPAHAGWLGSASLAFSADGETLAAHTALGTVIVWHLPTLAEELRELGMAW